MPKTCLDPGHAGGNTDPGACNPVTGLQEADVALAVSKLVEKYLSAAGCEVRLTRTEQEQPETDELSYRTGIANDWPADLLVSIHCNAATPGARGTETWYCAGSVNGERLATLVQGQVVNSLPVVDRGIKCATPGVNGLYMLSNTDMPAALVEMAFISNDGDERLLADSDTQDRFARAIARGITDYFAQIKFGRNES